MPPHTLSLPLFPLPSSSLFSPLLSSPSLPPLPSFLHLSLSSLCSWLSFIFSLLLLVCMVQKWPFFNGHFRLQRWALSTPPKSKAPQCVRIIYILWQSLVYERKYSHLINRLSYTSISILHSHCTTSHPLLKHIPNGNLCA